MVVTRSRSRQPATAAPTASTLVGDSESGNSNHTAIPPSLTHVYSERCWRQRTVRLLRHATATTPPSIDRQRLETADRYLTLTCRQLSPRTREYIVRSDAPLLNTIDYVVAVLTVLLLAWLALARPELWLEPHAAIALLPLAVTAASKLQTVRHGLPLSIHSFEHCLTPFAYMSRPWR